MRCEARVSEFYFTKNPNLKRGRGWVGGGGASVSEFFLLNIQIENRFFLLRIQIENKKIQ